jgi:radical SAM superfamily enzyme YgiQ (UPF0313 family)
VETYLQTNGRGVDRIGITATTPQFPQAVLIALTVRANSPSTEIIFGGAHATLVGSAYDLDRKKCREGRGTFAYQQMIDMFDKIVIGDGEKAIFETFKDGTSQVIDAGKPTSSLFLARGTLDDFPFPARHLIDFASYHYQIDGLDAQSLIAQLGCPFQCGFCGGRDAPAFRVTRTRSTESILAEVDELVCRYGKRGIMFYDDELNIKNDSLMELLGGLTRYQIDHKLELRLRGFVKAELFTQEQAKAMYAAGFRILLSGIESGDREMLETMRKNTTPEINSRLLRYGHEAGLKMKALMSIGHPGESEQTIENSLKWVLENRPDDVDWTIITEYPGSPYFDQSTPHPEKEGVWIYTEPKIGNVLYSQAVNFANTAEYYKGVPGDYTSYVWTEALSPDELVKQRDRCEITSRQELGLPSIVSVPAQQFEHSMGQRLPHSILRSSQ